MCRWSTGEARLSHGNARTIKGPRRALVTPWQLKELSGSSQGLVTEIIL